MTKTMRSAASVQEPRKLYILVMGLTGAGKSALIYVLTENEDIQVADASQMHRVTTTVQDYVLCYQYNGKPYEIHLIDSPGFDDDYIGDAEVLKNIADYVNTTYLLKERLAGVLYLHDITKAKMGGVGKRNIRMLEQMIGVEKFDNCTVVTTKWGCTTSSQDEVKRENALRTDMDFFGSMLHNDQHHPNATMQRFDPKSKGRALDIIKPYLHKEFTPNISKEMVDPKGPKLSLGETEAGKVVSENLEKLAQLQSSIKKEKFQAAKDILSQKYDEELFAEFKEKRKELRRRICLQRSGRWIMRTTIVGGAIVATVLTMGPGAAAFVLEPAFEKAAIFQRKDERQKKAALESDFERKSKDGKYLKTVNPRWLWDPKVHNLKDLDGGGYNRMSNSSDDLIAVAKKGGTVGYVVEGEESGEGLTMIGKEIGGDSESSNEEYDYTSALSD